MRTLRLAGRVTKSSGEAFIFLEVLAVASYVLLLLVGCSYSGVVDMIVVSADMSDLMQPTPFFRLLIIKNSGQSLSKIQNEGGRPQCEWDES